MTSLGPHPGASTPDVSRRMSVARRKDTKPELDLRRLLHARGLRYRVTYPVPGRPRRTMDVAFTRAKVAIFLDGCFWHGCPEHATQPRANADWWRQKLRDNVERDADTTRVLTDQGWTVLRFWEHEEPASIADAIEAVLRESVTPR
ncbi:very short patch repair endonuclease [Promicromonospora citrea]|nr:very short patch repair endonuclease [Promicromonospora citrea]NNH51542.1 very short patch repair endonuclease [Promicromonospora citrea]